MWWKDYVNEKTTLPWTTPQGYCLALTVLFPTFTSSTLPTTAKGRWAWQNKQTNKQLFTRLYSAACSPPGKQMNEGWRWISDIQVNDCVLSSSRERNLTTFISHHINPSPAHVTSHVPMNLYCNMNLKSVSHGEHMNNLFVLKNLFLLPLFFCSFLG